MSERLQPAVGMKVRLRKSHPCGSDTFVVIATGADIRLSCNGCGSKVFIERARFAARVKSVVPAADA
ncbi:MAG: DUF951 domain-containing protein [Candidatus Dormibacteria bacterium]